MTERELIKFVQLAKPGDLIARAPERFTNDLPAAQSGSFRRVRIGRRKR